jgi:hypothetical protein
MNYKIGDKFKHKTLFADDKLTTIEAVNEQCKVDNICLINAAHNKKEGLDEGITRVNSLFETVRFLRRIK